MTLQQIVETRFPTIGDIVKDPVFIEKATEYFETRKKARENRVPPDKGRYVRDLFDNFLESGEGFIPAVANVWGKVSKQPSAVRQYIRAAGDGLFHETVTHYYQLEKEKVNE